MSTRVMLFIDGTWLAVTANRLADSRGLMGRTGGPLDFGALPRVASQHIASQMGFGGTMDVVRTHYFGSIAANYDAADQDVVQRRSDFFDSLRRQHRYEVYRFETDYRGGRVRREFRGEDAGPEPREKAVDVGLATSLLEMAALSAYDIALVVCGDRDFVPALQAVRRLGKRVALLSARGSCPREFSDPNDPARLRDFDMLWLDELWPQVVSPGARTAGVITGEVVVERAASPGEQGAAESMPTADVPSPSPVHISGPTPLPEATPEPSAVVHMTGVVTKVHANGYGFVRGDDGENYYFRRSDVLDVEQFARFERFRTRVNFRVETPASGTEAGRAVGLDALEGLRAIGSVGSSTNGYTRSATPVWTPPVARTSVSDALWDVDPFAAPSRVTAAVPIVNTTELRAAAAELAPVAPTEQEAPAPLGTPVASEAPVSPTATRLVTEHAPVAAPSDDESLNPYRSDDELTTGEVALTTGDVALTTGEVSVTPKRRRTSSKSAAK